tara:strand:+ start:1312 stop:1860 length:549 start_codon:yes stop_codon:yes gene_type:complete
MANKKITELTELVAAATDDVLAIVDVSGTAETKKITVANLTSGASGLLTQAAFSVANVDVVKLKYDNTPLVLVAAIAGKIIVPVSVTIEATYNLATDTAAADLRCGWDAVASASTYYWDSKRRFMNGVVVDEALTFSGGVPSSSGVAGTTTCVNKALELWSTAAFDGGFTMEVYVTYYTITV